MGVIWELWAVLKENDRKSKWARKGVSKRERNIIIKVGITISIDLGHKSDILKHNVLFLNFFAFLFIFIFVISVLMWSIISKDLSG